MEDAQRIAHCWLVGVIWRLRNRCECPACMRSTCALIADTARLMLVVNREKVFTEMPS
jgi:hypothetical protein